MSAIAGCSSAHPPGGSHTVVLQDAPLVLFRWSETFETAVCFSQSGLASLRPDAWVDTTAIEWCICLVARRAATSSLRTAVCPPSQFRVHPEERRNPDTPSTAACKGNRFPSGDLDVVLFPVGTDGHWSLAALCHPGVPASYTTSMEPALVRHVPSVARAWLSVLGHRCGRTSVMIGLYVCTLYPDVNLCLIPLGMTVATCDYADIGCLQPYVSRPDTDICRVPGMCFLSADVPPF